MDDRIGEAVVTGLRKCKHPGDPERAPLGTFFFARPIAIRVTRKGLEAGLDAISDASAAGV